MAETDSKQASEPGAEPAHGAVNASTDEPALAAQLRRASELVSAQRLDEAETELLSAQASAPRDLRVLKLLALVRYKLGRLEAAAEVYREAAQASPDEPALRLNLGLIALKLESFAEAARELEAAVQMQPDDRRAWSYLGYAYARSSAPAQAAVAFRRAGQHELAAEMERAASPPSHEPEPAVVEGFPTERATGRGGDPSLSTMATPRPILRAEATPVPVPRSEEPVPDQVSSLADFTTARLLSLAPLTSPLASLGEGVLRFQAGAETHVRESSLLVALGSRGLSLARRRIRGQLTGEPLSSPTDRFFRVDGGGEILLFSPDRKRGLVALSLEHDVFYVEEDRVVAWGDEVVWESGAVPGSGKALLQFRGAGRVVIATGENELVALRIAEGETMAIPTARIAGWLGRVVVQGKPSEGDENVPSGLQQVTCEGEGVLLLSRHGEHR